MFDAWPRLARVENGVRPEFEDPSILKKLEAVFLEASEKRVQ